MTIPRTSRTSVRYLLIPLTPLYNSYIKALQYIKLLIRTVTISKKGGVRMKRISLIMGIISLLLYEIQLMVYL